MEKRGVEDADLKLDKQASAEKEAKDLEESVVYQKMAKAAKPEKPPKSNREDQ
jgi:hypothetical protein